MEKEKKILVLNNGSTSIKLAGFSNKEKQFEVNIDLPKEELAGFTDKFDQISLRKKKIEECLNNMGINIAGFDLFACRGIGNMPGLKMKAGGYEINDELAAMCRKIPIPHASSLGPVMVNDWVKEYGIKGYIYDSEGLDEYCDWAKLSGHKDFPLTCGSHALNQKAAARRCAEKLGGRYEDYSIIVAHLGGGCSAALHYYGQMIDSDSDGYSPERWGGITCVGAIDFVRACFSGKYTQNEMLGMLLGGGGLMSYLGTSDFRKIEDRINNGDQEAEFYARGMAYGLAKDIAGMAACACGNVDRIVFTGGLAFSKWFTEELKRRVEFIAPVELLPGTFEMEALAEGVLRISEGEPVNKLGFYELLKQEETK